jgi:hypothetical protein
MSMRLIFHAGQAAATTPTSSAAASLQRHRRARDAEHREQRAGQVGEGRRQRQRQQQPGQAADQRDEQAFAEQQPHHEARRKAQRLQRGVLGQPLARGHRHGVGHHRHDDDDDDAADRLQRHQDGLAHRDEAELEGLLGLGQRLGQRVAELLVDALRDHRAALAGSRMPHHVDADVIAMRGRWRLRGVSLTGSCPVHQHLVLVGAWRPRRRRCRAGEGPGAGVDGAAQRDLVAHLPAELVGQLAPHHHALAVAQPGQALVVLEHELGVQRQVAGASTANCGKKLRSVM